MAKPKKTVPDFETGADERAFWESHDSAEYVDWGKAMPVRFPSVKPSTTTISIRLPIALLKRITIDANKRDVPCQSLIKAWPSNDIDRHQH